MHFVLKTRNLALKTRNFVFKMMNFAQLAHRFEDEQSTEQAQGVIKQPTLFCSESSAMTTGKVAICIQIDEFCIKMDEFCIKNDGFCI